jgi:hypothetical protein
MEKIHSDPETTRNKQTKQTNNPPIIVYIEDMW